mmetsp:Transcript_77944/g.170754  ORF Transcript_77944/g.170754 Transcript_77944/m.170754 type:complete len:205 (-) Transcript_77944:34-648(-)
MHLHWLVHGDSRAQDRPGALQGIGFRDDDGKLLVHNKFGGVATQRVSALWVGSRSARTILLVVRLHHLLALLFVSSQALLALEARIDHAADTNVVPDLHFRHLLADGDADPCKLVARNASILRRHATARPVVGGNMEVAVADATILHVDQDVLGSNGTALHLHGLEVATRVLASHAENVHWSAGSHFFSSDRDELSLPGLGKQW